MWENEGHSFRYTIYDGVMMVESLDGCREFGLEVTVWMMVVMNCGWLGGVCVCSMCERGRERGPRTVWSMILSKRER